MGSPTSCPPTVSCFNAAPASSTLNAKLHRHAHDPLELARFNSFDPDLLPALGARSRRFVSIQQNIIIPNDARYRFSWSLRKAAQHFYDWNDMSHSSPYEVPFLWKIKLQYLSKQTWLNSSYIRLKHHLSIAHDLALYCVTLIHFLTSLELNLAWNVEGDWSRDCILKDCLIFGNTNQNN